MMMDYFEAKSVLGLSDMLCPSADEVNQAYRTKAKQCHPDAGGTNEDFARLVDAKDTLLKAASMDAAKLYKKGRNVGDVRFHETKMSQKLKAELDRVGALCFKVHGHAMQSSGWPDLQVYSTTWTGHLELKVEDRKAEPLQLQRIKDLRAAGTKAYVLRLRLDEGSGVRSRRDVRYGGSMEDVIFGIAGTTASREELQRISGVPGTPVGTLLVDGREDFNLPFPCHGMTILRALAALGR